MKKLFTLFFALVATSALWAEDFSVGGIYYNILADETNEVEVTYGSTEYSSSVTIPKTVTYYGTTYSVTSIGEYAFAWCDGLTSVTLGNSVTSIGDGAFEDCSGLTSITIPNSVKSIGDRVFAYSGLTSITIPNSVTSIGDWAFYECPGLTSITIPNSVTSIEGYAFAYCSSLTSVTIPNSVTSIGYGAFSDCSGLTSATIGNSVTSIGEYAFYRCKGLTSVNVLAEVPPTLGNEAFYNVSKKIPVYVPCSSVSAYQSAKGWKAFTNIQCMLEDESAVDNVHSQSTNSQKLLRNGQLIIIRDGVEYNAMGVEL